MNIKTGTGNKIFRMLSIFTIAPILALAVVAIAPPESTKAA